MKIDRVESLLIGDWHFVRIVTADGLVGTGQSACWGYPGAVHAMVEVFRPYLIGQDPRDIERHWQHLYRMGPFRGSVLSAAVSAIDIALWDIAGQRLGVPIWELLGGKARDRIRLYLLIEATTPAEIHQQAKDATAQGFTAIKLDPVPPGYQDLALPALVSAVVERVASAREAVGDDVDVAVELHRKLSPVQALGVMRELPHFRPLFVEDPIQIDSISSQAEIARAAPVALAQGERLHSIWEFRELLVQGGAQFVRPDVGLAGGISQCRKIAAIAESFHASVVFHNFLTPLLTAASAHLDTTIPNFVVQEYTSDDEGEAADAFVGRLKREGGYLPVPDAPGLGVTIDEQKLRSLRLPRRELHEIPRRSDGSVAYSV